MSGANGFIQLDEDIYVHAVVVDSFMKWILDLFISINYYVLDKSNLE